MLEPWNPRLFGASPSSSSSSSASLLLFSLRNCKYQVPFILLFLLLLYCCSCNFFSLVDRRSSVRTVYPQSQSVNTISFQSLVQEGKHRTKCFIFTLSPISLFTTFPFPPINVVITVLFIVLFFLGGVGDSFPLRWYNWGFFFVIPNLSPTMSHAKRFHIQDTVQRFRRWCVCAFQSVLLCVCT